ncbi:MAG: hypothetical protein JWL79_85 [Frankiales bacterium]|nr:hypothetical protein [Frankiales bacterium]
MSDTDSLVLYDAPASRILLDMADAAWGSAVPPLVVAARAANWREATPSGFLRNGALTSEEPMPFVDGARQPGERFDQRLSPFQCFSYVRHVRDHPGYRTERHYTLATERDLVRFLVWSLRMFADSQPVSPLPLGLVDLAHLNEYVPNTGVRKGRTTSLLPLPLTAAQVEHNRDRGEPLLANSDEQYADWLLSFLGSWGWGHRGRVLLTQEQIGFLQGLPKSAKAGTVGEVCELSRFALARIREHPALASAYQDLHVFHVRLQVLMELAAGEIRTVGTSLLLPRELIAALRLRSSDNGPSTDISNADAPVVRVIGMVNSQSGLGQNARNSVEALESRGFAPAVLSLSLHDRSVAQSLTASGGDRPPPEAKVNLWHLNPDNIPEAVMSLRNELFQRSYNIGFFAWELDRQPRAHELAVEWIDEIWVPSDYCARSFRTITDKPVVTMPHCVALPTVPPVDRTALGITPETFLVHASFDMHSWPQRKNPLGVLEVFQAAFSGDEDVRLLMRVRNGHNIGEVDSDRDGVGESLLEIAEQDERVLVDIQERDYAETLSLIAESDCHISLHRSEGFGYSVAEALAVGTPVITSDYGGTSEFANGDNAWLVPCCERYLREGDYYLAPPGAVWGEPDLEVAISLLRRLRNADDDVTKKAARGKEMAAEAFSVATMATRYADRLTHVFQQLESRRD